MLFKPKVLSVICMFTELMQLSQKHRHGDTSHYRYLGAHVNQSWMNNTVIFYKKGQSISLSICWGSSDPLKCPGLLMFCPTPRRTLHWQCSFSERPSMWKRGITMSDYLIRTAPSGPQASLCSITHSGQYINFCHIIFIITTTVFITVTTISLLGLTTATESLQVYLKKQSDNCSWFRFPLLEALLKPRMWLTSVQFLGLYAGYPSDDRRL